MTDADSNGALLAVEDLVAGYVPEVDILTGVELTVREGEIVTVIGPNGAGKSTLIKSIFGLLPPRRGRVILRGEDLAGLRPHSITRRGMSYVPQLDNIFQSLTVEENLEMGAVDPSRSREEMARVYELFPRLGERRTQTAGTMSGGERQLLAMGRALMPDPQVLLLDEPSAGLAPAFVEAIFAKVEEINQAGVTLVMVEQNARRALAMSDRGYVLDIGQNRFQGPGRELLEDPKVAELYLGGTARIDRAETAPSTLVLRLTWLGGAQPLGQPRMIRTATLGTSLIRAENSREPSTRRRISVSAVTVADRGP